MRILINYRYQYYPFTTASYLEMAMRADKRIEVFRIGENRIPCADLIINVEPCEYIITYPGKLSVYWEIDNHIKLGQEHERYAKSDIVFCTQKGYLDLYPKNKSHWLPLACDPEKHRLYPDEPIEYDIGFIGNDTYPWRRSLLENMNKKYKLLWTTSKPGEEYSRLLSRCKLLFNCALANDLNMRVFEALSIGRMLLTDKVDGQDELLEDGKDYESFRDWDELDKKIEYYLSHDIEREKIAKTGREHVHAVHTYQDRFEEILKTCGIY